MEFERETVSAGEMVNGKMQFPLFFVDWFWQRGTEEIPLHCFMEGYSIFIGTISTLYGLRAMILYIYIPGTEHARPTYRAACTAEYGIDHSIGRTHG